MTARQSYRTVLEDAAEYCDELAAIERQTWEGYRDYRWQRPRDTALALRAFIVLVKDAETLAAHDDYPETYSALASRLLDRIAAGPPSP